MTQIIVTLCLVGLLLCWMGLLATGRSMTWRFLLRFMELVSAIAAFRQSVKLYVMGNEAAAYYSALVSVLFVVLALSRAGKGRDTAREKALQVLRDINTVPGPDPMERMIHRDPQEVLARAWQHVATRMEAEGINPSHIEALGLIDKAAVAVGFEEMQRVMRNTLDMSMN